MQMADAKMVQYAVNPQENPEMKENECDIVENDEDCNDAEFQAINAQLDQLNSALDSLEQKNDNIRAELVDLLESNREARKQFQESQKECRLQLEKPNS